MNLLEHVKEMELVVGILWVSLNYESVWNAVLLCLCVIAEFWYNLFRMIKNSHCSSKFETITNLRGEALKG